MYVANKMANIEVFNGTIRLNSDRDTLEKCFHLMSGSVIIIIPSKMEVSTAMMSYDFKMSSDYNYDVLKL